MRNLIALTVPLALVLPIVAVAEGPAPKTEPVVEGVAPQINPLSAMRGTTLARQVRIEQRVLIRITPQPMAARQSLSAELPQRQSAPRFEERQKEKCLPLQGIAGVQTGSGNRLVLFLRDQRMISVNLEKSCRARDFYSGFYVEKNKDGRLCVDRDKLQSRTGAACEVAAMRQLVAVPN
jgi:hypothetical protein